MFWIKYGYNKDLRSKNKIVSWSPWEYRAPKAGKFQHIKISTSDCSIWFLFMFLKIQNQKKWPNGNFFVFASQVIFLWILLMIDQAEPFVSNRVGIIWLLPGWDRVNWSVKIWWEPCPPPPPLRQPCIAKDETGTNLSEKSIMHQNL